MINPIHLPALFKYPSHASYVFASSPSGRIHCVKYSNRGLEWEWFDQSHVADCQEYMITDVVDERWGFQEDSD